MKKHYFLWLVIHCILFVLLISCRTSLLLAQNYVTTYAGDGISGFVNGDTASAQFKSPFGMCIDNSNNIFIADQDNNCIRKITPEGIVSTYAGTGVAGYADGIDSLAQFNGPIDLCSDNAGNIYVSDFSNQYIRKIAADGIVSTIAGNGVAGYVDGAATLAEFDYPRGICIDASGNLYIGDSWNHRIRKIDVNGEVSTYAGGGTSMGVQSVGDYLDGNDTSARFYTPCGLSIDDAGNIYVADAYNHRVRRVDPSRVVTTIAGSGSSGTSSGGFADGSADTARFNTLTELYADHNGRIFIGDTYNHRIRMVSGGFVNTIAGNGVQGFVDGIDSLAEFNRPRGVILDSSGNHLYVCDNLNHVIRKITLGVATGSTELVSDNNMIVFPNPSSGIFYLAGNMMVTEIKVTDLSGAEIFSGKYFDSPQELNLKNLSPGIYFLTLYSKASWLKTMKLLISR